MTGNSILTVVGFIGTIAALVHQGFLASRERRRISDKQRQGLETALQAAEAKADAAASELAEKTVELARLLAAQNKAIAAKASRRSRKLEKKLQENTLLTKEGIVAANDINNKIADNQQAIETFQKTFGTSQSEQLERIERSSDMHAEKLSEAVRGMRTEISPK